MGENIVVVDVGSGTQDILIYQAGKNMENCPKLVVPSQTQVVAKQIREATIAREPIYLYGHLMGGGACSVALKNHLAAGLKAHASPQAALTFDDKLEKVEGMGVILTQTSPPGTKDIWLGDVNIQAIEQIMTVFGLGEPDQCIIAVQDHGFSLTGSNREVRMKIWNEFLCSGGELSSLVYRHEIPEELTRMRSVRDLISGAVVADTGTAAILGIMSDPVVQPLLQRGVIAVNVGNSHTLAAAIRGDRVYGLFEQHTSGMNTDKLAESVKRLQRIEITHEEVFQSGGHGAVIGEDMKGEWEHVVVTGPRRAMARPLGWYEAAPFGDMMLTGCFGLLKGIDII